MRLINVKTSRLEEFPGSNVPPYAILSHTWGSDSEELNFRDIENGNIDKPGIGSLKLRGCSQLAAKDGLGYAWIDTCCIDKTNLVELSEAINSMFRWYQSAAICYAFLSDVRGDENPQQEGSTFRKSRWFQRGWTLQEILAPKKLRFYGIVTLSGTSSAQDATQGNAVYDWRLLGTKGNMSTTISSITGIPREYLLGVAQLHEASVAQRMSWAAHRETKRKEDLAYCLLGIFNITMPMIYGEGSDQAFFRLQEQIMKLTRDDSILAWGFHNEPSADKPRTVTSGRAMAKSPLDFANCGHIIRRDHLSQYMRSVDISGGSIRVHLPLVMTSDNQVVGLLGCGPEDNAQQVVGISLVELSGGSPDEYIRPQGYSSSLYSIALSQIMPKQIQIKHDSQDSASIDSSGLYFHYEEEDFSKINLKMIDVEPQSCWDKERALIISRTGNDTVPNQILLRLRHTKAESKDFIIVLGYGDQRPDALAECLVFMSSRNTSLEKCSKNLPLMMDKLDGKVRVKNGLMSLRVTLERFKRQPIFVIRPEKILDEAYATVDATVDPKENNLEERYLLLSEEGELAVREEKVKEDEIYLQSKDISDAKREGDSISVQNQALEQGIKTSNGKENDSAGRQFVLSSKESAAEGKLRDTSFQNQEYRHLEDLIATLTDQTALRWAAAKGLIKVVERLLDKGADVNAADKDGWTPLLAVSAYEHVEVAKILIEKGADLEAKVEGDLTPLLVASTAGRFEMVRLLLEQGAAVDAEDTEGITPLIAASFVGNVDIVLLLLQYGAQKNTKTKGDLTALKMASMGGHNDVVEILLSNGETDIEGNNSDNLESAPLNEIPASEFPLLEAFDPLWRQHFGQYINDKELPDNFIKENQEFVVEFFKKKQTTQKSMQRCNLFTHTLLG